jgi:hypothetical protein
MRKDTPTTLGALQLDETMLNDVDGVRAIVRLGVTGLSFAVPSET